MALFPPASAAYSSGPLCTACTRRVTRLGLSSWTPNQFQHRGKKKNAKARATISIKLLQDIPTFGRKGAIIPVPIGRMRNHFFPKRMAEYVPMDLAKELKRNNVEIHRDVTFGVVQPEVGEDVKVRMSGNSPVRRPQAVRINLDLLKPEAAFGLLNSIIPPSIEYYRAPIQQTSSPKSHRSSDKDAMESSKEDAASSNKTPATLLDIYGSVTTADVANSLRALIADTDLSGKFILEVEDITFTGQEGKDEETDRVKRLGSHEIVIRVKGHDEVLARTVRVLAEGDRNTSEAEKEASATEASVASEAVDAFVEEQSIEDGEVRRALSTVEGVDPAQNPNASSVRHPNSSP